MIRLFSIVTFLTLMFAGFNAYAQDTEPTELSWTETHIEQCEQCKDFYDQKPHTDVCKEFLDHFRIVMVSSLLDVPENTVDHYEKYTNLTVDEEGKTILFNNDNTENPFLSESYSTNSNTTKYVLLARRGAMHATKEIPFQEALPLIKEYTDKGWTDCVELYYLTEPKQGFQDVELVFILVNPDE